MSYRHFFSRLCTRVYDMYTYTYVHISAVSIPPTPFLLTPAKEVLSVLEKQDARACRLPWCTAQPCVRP